MKIAKICTMLTACCLLAGCSNNNEKENKLTENDKKDDKTIIDEGKQEDELVLEPNTPQSWIDLFTFNNVTISVDYNLSIMTDYDYKCVDGKWYCKRKSLDTFEDHDGRYIFDTYLAHYSIFTFDAENNYYKAEDWSDGDESGYTHDIVIRLNENNRISSIVDSAENNSSLITTTLTFSKYGETTL